jgi:hypothetical protein
MNIGRRKNSRLIDLGAKAAHWVWRLGDCLVDKKFVSDFWHFFSVSKPSLKSTQLPTHCLLGGGGDHWLKLLLVPRLTSH